MISPSITVSSGSFARPATTAEYAEVVVVARPKVHASARLEGNGTVAIELQLVFPVLGVLRQGARSQQEHRLDEASGLFRDIGRESIGFPFVESRIGDTSRMGDARTTVTTARGDSTLRRNSVSRASNTGRRTSAPSDSDATVVGVRISHPDRLIYPDEGISKIQR
jgi:hypothetical protein